MDMSIGFLFSVLLATWALYHIWGSATGTLGRLLWSLFVLVFPFIGTLIWYFAGPKRIEVRT